MKSAWMQVCLIGFLILMAMAWSAAAEPRLLGDWCWRKVPFQDTVLVRVYTDDLDGEPHVPLTYNFWQLARTEYSLSGGGSGTINYSGGLLTLHAVAHNTHPSAFGGQPVLEFKAVIALDTFAGRQAIRGTGAPSAAATPWESSSGMQWIDCAEHGQPPTAQVSRSQASPQEWRVEGVD